MPTPTGKLIRGMMGKLARAANGALKRCGCCSDTPGPCTLVIRARVCSQLLDENCERLRQSNIWVCADILIDGVPLNITASQVFVAPGGGVCFRTDPTQIRYYDDLSESEQALIFNASVASAGSCSDVACGDIQAVCDCVCYTISNTDINGNPQSDTEGFCCFGKKDADGKVCVDWSLEGLKTTEIHRESRNGGIRSQCPYHITRDCNARATCQVFRQEFRSVIGSAPEDVCLRDCGNGPPSHEIQNRITLLRLAPPEDLCGLTVDPNGCDAPNSADNVWTSGSYENPGFPTKRGTRTTVTMLYGPDDYDGCKQEAKVTVTETYTCDKIEVETIEESWGAFIEGSYTGEGPNRCYCEVYRKETNKQTYTFTRGGAGDVECGQCLYELSL